MKISLTHIIFLLLSSLSSIPSFTQNTPPKPVRVYFKTGEDSRTFNNFTSIRGFSSRGIEGGAGTVLNLPLNPAKELKSIILKAVANDVIIGLMSLTLVR